MWWGLGLAALTLLTVLFYPSVREATELNNLLGDSDSIARAFIGDVEDLTSPQGFLNSQLFFLMVPILFLVFAIGQGSGAIAGEEERGTLDLMMCHPLARSRVVTQKFAAMSVAICALGIVLWAGVAVGAAIVGMEIGLGRVAEMTVSGVLLGTVFGAGALALGSATGKRGLCIGVMGALGVTAYFFNALAPAVDFLEPARRLSPFYYYTGADPLTNGLNLTHAGVLIGVAAALVAVAVITFDRRDLGV